MKNDDNHKFNLKHDCAEITAALRLVRNRNTGIVPFEMHFGRPPNTVLRNIASKATPENLGYIKVLYILDELQLGPKKALLKKESMKPDADNFDNEVKLTREVFDREAHRKRQFDISSGLILTQGIELLHGPPNVERRAKYQLAKKKINPRAGRKSLDTVWEILPDNTRLLSQTPDTTTLKVGNKKPFLIRNDQLAKLGAIANDTFKFSNFAATKTIV